MIENIINDFKLSLTPSPYHLNEFENECNDLLKHNIDINVLKKKLIKFNRDKMWETLENMIQNVSYIDVNQGKHYIYKCMHTLTTLNEYTLDYLDSVINEFETQIKELESHSSEMHLIDIYFLKDLITILNCAKLYVEHKTLNNFQNYIFLTRWFIDYNEHYNFEKLDFYDEEEFEYILDDNIISSKQFLNILKECVL